MDAPPLSRFLLDARPSSVLILSSRAGGGNHSAGEALTAEVAAHCTARLVAIEDVIGPRLRATDFKRHHWLCSHVPFALNLTYRVPFFYWLKMKRAGAVPLEELAPLVAIIRQDRPDVILALNHRAALWAGTLKKRGAISGSIWAMATDFKVSLGWRWILWDQVDRFFAPVASGLAARLGRKAGVAAIPVKSDFHQLGGVAGSGRDVLVTGGAWGLGPLPSVVSILRRSAPGLRIHVACGSNEGLFRRLAGLESEGIFGYQAQPSLAPLMAKCGAVVTRPGALTLSEAFAARRKIFVLDGLPVVEAENRRHAIRHFGAVPFSGAAVAEWASAAD